MSAPLVNVANTPHIAWETSAQANEFEPARTRNATPAPARPITTESRRLTVSAITPVGTSKTR